jgi:hypothetical protein
VSLKESEIARNCAPPPPLFFSAMSVYARTSIFTHLYDKALALSAPTPLRVGLHKEELIPQVVEGICACATPQRRAQVHSVAHAAQLGGQDNSVNFALLGQHCRLEEADVAEDLHVFCLWWCGRLGGRL